MTGSPTLIREHFDGARLPSDFQWLRSPWPDDLFSLTERPGFLRLYGRETVGSLFEQALVFEPRHFQQMAGECPFPDSVECGGGTARGDR